MQTIAFSLPWTRSSDCNVSIYVMCQTLIMNGYWIFPSVFSCRVTARYSDFSSHSLQLRVRYILVFSHQAS